MTVDLNKVNSPDPIAYSYGFFQGKSGEPMSKDKGLASEYVRGYKEGKAEAGKSVKKAEQPKLDYEDPFEDDWQNFGDVNPDKYGGIYIKKDGDSDVMIVSTTDMKEQMSDNEYKDYKKNGGSRYMFQHVSVSREQLLNDKDVQSFGGTEDEDKGMKMLHTAQDWLAYYGGDGEDYFDTFDEGLKSFGISGMNPGSKQK
jgi:hypothetical protein